MSKLDIVSFKPLGKRILVLPEPEGELKSKGGIIIAQETAETVKRDIKGTIVAIGDKVDEVQIGDVVSYKKMFELSINILNTRHVVLDLSKEHVTGVYTQ